MLNKILIQRKLNIKLEALINEILSLLEADKVAEYEVEKAQFITAGLIDADSLYKTSKSFDLEDKWGIEELIVTLKKDIMSEFTTEISIDVDGEPKVLITQNELSSFRKELVSLENNLYAKTLTRAKDSLQQLL